MNDSGAARLERSCGAMATDWMRIAPSCREFERVEAFFAGHAFDPHRHDAYAVGFTLEGVQAFRYRGAATRSLPGQVFVLHPDEVHDGRAGSSVGFRYRILYVAPRAISDALSDGRHPLPFVREAVSRDRRLVAAITPALRELDVPPEELHRDQIVLDLAEALAAADPSMVRRKLSTRHWRAVDRCAIFSMRASAAPSPRQSWSPSRVCRGTPWPGISAPALARALIVIWSCGASIRHAP